METRSRKRKDHPTHSTAAYSKAPKVGRKAEVAEPVEPHKRACHQGRASSKRDARAGVASPRASGHSSKEARQAGQRGKDKKQDAQPAKMDSSSRRLRSENEDEMMEDDHDDVAAQLLGRAGGSATSALQGLLRKLGAGLDDVFPGVTMGGARFKDVVASLQTDDEAQQLEALSHLCEVLSLSAEDSLLTFPVDQTVPLLVNILNVGMSPDLLVLAARALTLLADVLPSSCSTIVRHDGVPALCARLLSIEYIDLAEQCLQALEKLSNEHPQACLRSGALLAVLSFIDFFQTGVQRVAVATAANMCRGLSAEHLDALQSAVPILTGLLQYDDSKVVDNACVALTRIAYAFADQPQHLALLANGGVVAAARQLIDVPEGGAPATQLSSATYLGLLKLLATTAAGCGQAAELLLQSRVSGTLRALLAGAGSPGSLGGALASGEQLSDALTLASVLLPPVPDPVQFVVAAGAAGKLDVKVPLTAGWTRTQAGPERRLIARADEARQFVEANPQLLQQVAEDLLPTLLQLHGSTVLPQVRSKCLTTIAKIVVHAPPAVLTVLLHDVPASSFIAGLLTSDEPPTACAALQLASVLLTKLPDVFCTHFFKEGVVHALRKLAAKAGNDERREGRRRATRSRSAEADERAHPQEEAGEEGERDIRYPYLPKGTWAAAWQTSRLLLDEHFGGDEADAPLETDGIRVLTTLCDSLDTPVTWTALCDLLAGQGDVRVSTFELLNSGVLQRLVEYLQGTNIKGKDVDHQRLQRLHAVASALLPAGSGLAPPALSLVRSLQACISALESFPVPQPAPAIPMPSIFRMAGLSGIGGSMSGSAAQPSNSLSNGLAALSQPLKLRLCLQRDASGLRDYGSTVVLVDPLASLTAVEEFLWPRVGQAARRTPRGEPRSEPAPPRTDPSASAPSPRRTGLRSQAKQAGGPSSSEPQQPASAPIRAPRGRRQGSTDAPETPSSVGTPQAGTPQAGSGSMRRVTRYMMRQLSMQQSGEGDDATRGGTPEKVIDRRGSDVVDDDGDMIEVEEEDDEYEDDVLGAFEEEEDDADSEEEDDEDDPAMEQHGAMQRHASRVQHTSLETEEGRQGAAEQGRGRSGRSTQAASSYAHAARQAEQAPPRLVFSVGNRVLHPSTTVFQAVQQHGEQEAADAPRRRHVWERVHTLHYRAYNADEDASLLVQEAPAVQLIAPRAHSGAHSGLESLLKTDLPDGLEALGGEQGARALFVLRLLHDLSALSPLLAKHIVGYASQHPPGAIADSEFVSDKLSAKLGQQLKDVVAICGGALPPWCHMLARGTLKFLTPFELRRQYFYSTSFGMVRALHHLEQMSTADAGGGARSHRMPRLQRQKVRISRKRILESASKVMDLYARHKVVLELEYQGEVGTGLGPTLEFYTLLSHELQRSSLRMWRDAQRPPTSHPARDAAGDALLVHAPQGLFPAPMDAKLATSEDGIRVLAHFRLLGRAVAKALQDARLMDLPLSRALWRRALGVQLTLHDVADVDPELGATLQRLASAVDGKVDGVPVEDLCLCYEVPGHAGYDLGKRSCAVTSANLPAFIDAVVDATVGRGVEAQVSAFVEAFNEVFDIRALDAFSPEELDMLLCGTSEAWNIETLTDVIKFDHGYTTQSQPAQHLLTTLAEFDHAEQRRFLRFVTGSPRLPPGGLAALQPRLTVVRKHSSSGDGQSGASGPSLGPSVGSLGPMAQRIADTDLPSVMTCANYIKLPPYSSKDVLRARILFAINEGQGSFDLS